MERAVARGLAQALGLPLEFRLSPAPGISPVGRKSRFFESGPLRSRVRFETDLVRSDSRPPHRKVRGPFRRRSPSEYGRKENPAAEGSRRGVCEGKPLRLRTREGVRNLSVDQKRTSRPESTS